MTAKQTERFLCTEMSEIMGISYREARKIYHAIIDAMVAAHRRGENIRFTGIGNIRQFECKPRYHYLDGIRLTKHGEDRVWREGRRKSFFITMPYMKKLLNEEYLGTDTLEELYEQQYRGVLPDDHEFAGSEEKNRR